MANCSNYIDLICQETTFRNSHKYGSFGHFDKFK